MQCQQSHLLCYPRCRFLSPTTWQLLLVATRVFSEMSVQTCQHKTNKIKENTISIQYGQFLPTSSQSCDNSCRTPHTPDPTSCRTNHIPDPLPAHNLTHLCHFKLTQPHFCSHFADALTFLQYFLLTSSHSCPTSCIPHNKPVPLHADAFIRLLNFLLDPDTSDPPHHDPQKTA